MQTDFLTTLLSPQRLSRVVDVGANPIDGDPPYKKMLQMGLCEVTGFEPQADALQALNNKKSSLETYLPFALGAGGAATLHICQYSGWTSLLKPRASALEVFPFFKANATVVGTIDVQTHRMDDLHEVKPFDLLKIDVQGAELDVFRGAQRLLGQAVAVQTEVSFITLYEGQPGFGEVDATLRAMGFIPHCFAAMKTGPLGPLNFDQAPHRKHKQLIEADLVYFKDTIEPDSLTDEQIKQLALVAYHCYDSVDVVGRCLQLLAQRGACAGNALQSFVDHINGSQPSLG